MSIVIEYNSNNSGGSWWLKDEDWLKLEAAGWKVQRATDGIVYENGNDKLDEDGLPVFGPSDQFTTNGKYLGSAFRQNAWKRFDSPGDAIREFEKLTGQDVMDEGCNCCGPPHSFSWDGGYASGESCDEYLFPGKDEAKLTKRQLLERG